MQNASNLRNIMLQLLALSFILQMESSKKPILKNGVDKQKRKTLDKPKSNKDRIDQRSQ